MASRKISRQVDGKTIQGKTFPAFIHNDLYFAVDIEVYQDGQIFCWDWVNLEGFEKKIKKGWVVTTLPENARVSFSQVANFNVTNVKTFIKEEDFLLEIKNAIEVMNGEPSLSKKCWDAFIGYITAPTEDKREELRITYYQVPTHLRKYVLHDMDIKDGSIRSILEKIPDEHYLVQLRKIFIDERQPRPIATRANNVNPSM